ncbi:MAG: glycerol kinase GlpK [Bdellovibrionales bacterium]|nr:glycerol kinase GlpK [Bdellovibrionales bacterium]MBT3525548.1 glycerol kinase GlpK [Bdellovibrionales bacterium]MBT7668093.1 glycerol kinase GlpK [Bdellovibrionales bacterium]
MSFINNFSSKQKASMNFILAIDQGTTGTTAALINATSFEFVDQVNTEFPQIFPKPGWVEHNLDDIWQSVRQSVQSLLANNNLKLGQIKSIGITNQRETTCAFSRTGDPLANAIVWQDRRTSEYCRQKQHQLDSEGRGEFLRKKTGLPFDPYFSASKMNWLLNNNNNVAQQAQQENLLFGTIDTFLLYKLSGQKSYQTEPSNASRTLLMDLGTTNWDQELLELFSIKQSQLPTIVDSFGEFGLTSGLDFLPDGIPITGILGDQQSALFGQAGYKIGGIKCTYGTGAFILLNTGATAVTSNNGLLTTVAFRHQGECCYALEGSSFIAGAAVQWLRDSLKMIKSAPEVEPLALEVKKLEEMEHIIFFPYFSGVGSPHWLPDAKASIIGLTRDSNRAHIARATLDGIALSINDLFTAMREDSGLKIDTLKVDGGAVNNQLLMKIQATVSNLTIIRPQVVETTAYGAALAAAIGSDNMTFAQIDQLWKEESQFSPDKDETAFYQAKSQQWKSMIEKCYL